jgi:hypothetical protein
MTRYPNTAHGRGIRLPSLPSWFVSASVGEHIELPNSTLTTSGAGWTGARPGTVGNSYTAVVNAWGGGILNTVGIHYGGAFIPGFFLIVWGGGHGDWGGNDMYAYGPLQSDTPAWRRPMDPTIPAPTEVLRNEDGYPTSRHTYDTLIYLPSVNKMMTFGTPGMHASGSSLNGSDLFDFNVDPAVTNPWSANDTGFPAVSNGATISGMSGYNALTGEAWGIGRGNGQAWGKWSLSTGTWTAISKHNPYGVGSSSGDVADALNVFAFIDSNDDVSVQDLSSPAGAWYYPIVTGTGPSVNKIGLEWNATIGKFVAWTLTGKTLYFLTPGADHTSGGDDWTWTSVTPSGGVTPSNATANGVYGRFQYVPPPMHGMLIMPTHEAPMTFFPMETP